MTTIGFSEEMTMSDALTERIKRIRRHYDEARPAKAADEIARLTAELAAEREARKRLEAALRELAEAADSAGWSANIGTMDEFIARARAALGGSA
jgi:predicted RNase H-like nuclease (RuvC/YqgF family)